jgi:hypothetical protein
MDPSIFSNMRVLDRRDFLKLAALGAGGIFLQPLDQISTRFNFPSHDRLARVCVGKTDLKARPDGESHSVGVLYEDAVVPWLQEVVGQPHSFYASNLRWVETPDGFVWSPHLQSVRHLPNTPITTLDETSLGAGMWVEVTVPWVDLLLANPPARSPWLRDAINPRLYYSQILWVDEIKTDDNGKIWYRINERYSYGDIFWADAEAFRPLTDNDISPINPDVEDKRIEINLRYQTLSCFENDQEVFFCQISSGAKFDAQGNPVDKWSTPVGPHPIWRKVFSLHMSGGTTGGGYDLPGIGWTTLFAGTGVAIHATFWHSNYGEPMSHGCVNAKPEDAKWVFRWTTPQVPYDPGDITVSMPGGTSVDVIEG